MPDLKNARLALTTGGGTAYTCPAGKAAVVTRFHVANIDGSASVNVTVSWTDDSNSDAVTALCSGAAVIAGDALNVACKIVLEEGDTITGSASADGDAILTLAIEEWPLAV